MESTPDYEGVPAPNSETWWIELYGECLSSLIFICLKKARHEINAEAIASESFARLLETVKKEPGKLQDKLSMKKFLYRMAINACTDQWRKSKNNGGNPVDASEHDVVDEEELVMLLEQRDALMHVKALILKLPSSLQQIIRLYYLEGKSVEEIAGYLGRPVNSVRVDKTRGLNKLRELVKGKEQTISPGAALLILFWISTNG